jgi:hypothetical protein
VPVVSPPECVRGETRGRGRPARRIAPVGWDAMRFSTIRLGPSPVQPGRRGTVESPVQLSVQRFRPKSPLYKVYAAKPFTQAH